MKTKPLWLFLMGVLLLVGSVLGMAQLTARQRFLKRGIPVPFPAPVADTGMPRGCINANLEQYTEAELDWALDALTAGGFAWVRQRFSWAEIEPAPGDYRWDVWDRIVAEAIARELRLIAVLDTAPDWAGSPPDPAAYATFAAAFAERYGEHLTYYQIWHNPNLGGAWGGRADPYSYTELLSHAAIAIRTADPDARIILGSLAPTVETGEQNYAEDLFLEMLYAAGAGPYFDVVAVQPYGFHTGPEDRRVSRDLLNVSRANLVRETLGAHGEGHKAVWASHFGWNSLPAAWPGPPSIWGSVDEATQAAYTVATLARAEREWPWMGPLCLNGFQPRPETPGLAVPDAEEHWGFAIVGPEGTPRPVYTALRDWLTQPRAAMPGVYPAATELANFTGTWTLGPQGADIGQSGDAVTLTFEGTGVALTVRRGPYRAFLFVTVDGAPANALATDREGRAYVVLYDPLAEVATVPLAEGLPYGVHTVTIVAERGWGQWALVDWRITGAAPARAYRAGLLGWGVALLVGLALTAWGATRLAWGTLVARWAGTFACLGERGQVILAAAVGLIFSVAAWLTWLQGSFRRLGDAPGVAGVVLAALLFYLSPWLILTLVSGAALAALVFLRPELGLALVLAASPFHMQPLSLFGRTFSLAELVLLPTVAGGAAWWLHTRPSLRRLWRNRALWPVAAFVAVALLSTAQAIHIREALRELRLVIVEPALFFVLLLALPLTRRDRWRLLDFYVLGLLAVAVIGLVQYFILGDVITAEGGVERLRSIYGSPNNVGLALGRVLPVLIAVVLWSAPQPAGGGWRVFVRGLWQSPRRRLYALAALPIGAALLLTLSRGALVLGVPAALFTLGFLAGGRWRRAALLGLLLAVLALVPLFRIPRFAALLDPTQGTAGFRLSLWHSAWQMFRDHPLLGVGPDNFLYTYRTHYVLPTAWEEFNLSHPHNIVMDYATRLGVLGLLAFGWMQAHFWRRALPLTRRDDPVTRALALGFVAAMADFLAHGLVDASYFIPDLAYAFFFAWAMIEWLYLDDALGDGQRVTSDGATV